jgi:hypothetical protein
MMKHTEKCLLLALTSLVGIMVAEAAESNSLDVFVDTTKSHLWRTAETTSPEIQWETPEGAVSATLNVKSKYGLTAHDVTGETKFELALEVPKSADSENVYDLTLVFDFGSSNTVVRGQIGVVRGLGGSGAAGAVADIRKVDDGCSKFKGNSAVLQIPAGTKSLTIDGGPVTLALDGTAGWYGLNALSPKPGRVPYSFELSADDRAYVADVIVLSSGLSLIIK